MDVWEGMKSIAGMDIWPEMTKWKQCWRTCVGSEDAEMMGPAERL